MTFTFAATQVPFDFTCCKLTGARLLRGLAPVMVALLWTGRRGLGRYRRTEVGDEVTPTSRPSPSSSELDGKRPPKLVFAVDSKIPGTDLNINTQTLQIHSQFKYTVILP